MLTKMTIVDESLDVKTKNAFILPAGKIIKLWIRMEFNKEYSIGDEL